MQVYPVKLNLKLPATERLKLQCDDPLSTFAFNFYLRRYDLDMTLYMRIAPELFLKVGGDGIFLWKCLKLLCHIPDFLPNIPGTF